MKTFDAQSLKDRFLKEEEHKENKSNGSKKNPQFLNYFNLDFNQTMTIRLLPDGGDSGDLWTSYNTHGSGLKNRAIDSISCVYHESGESCPACAYSWGLHSDGNKKQAARWRDKETAVGQCVVVDSPIEITPSEDGNLVKKFYVPYGMREAIKEAMVNGIIDDPTAVNFVIKKTKNQGGQASYDKSFFKATDTDLPDVVIESLSDGGESYLYDLAEERPDVSTVEQVQEWLDKAIQTDRTGTSTPSSNSSAPNDSGAGGANDDSSPKDDSSSTPVPEAANKKTSAADLMSTLKNRKSA